MASMVGFYCVYNGPEGLKRAADTAHLAAATVAKALEAMDYKLAATAYFDTLEVAAEAAVVQSLALESGINFFYPTEGSVRMSFDEVTTPEEIAEVMSKVSLKQLDAPCILYNLNGYYNGLKTLLDHMIETGLSTKERQEGIWFAENLEQIKQILKA